MASQCTFCKNSINPSELIDQDENLLDDLSMMQNENEDDEEE